MPSILLVEDNEMVRTLVSEVLEPEYAVTSFNDAESALVHAAGHVFDVVLLDISLPRMSGVQAVSHFRRLPGYAATPIVAMTGHTSPETRAEYLSKGFTEHLAKPFLPDDLMDLLARLV